MIAAFADILETIEAHSRTIWLGQSVDTSTIHDAYEEFNALPILTSVGCAIRRPRAVSEKFDHHLRDRLGAKNRLMVDSGGYVLMTKQDSSWDVERVGNLYNGIDADHLVSLDVPPSAGDSRSDRVRKYDKTFQNLERLFDQFGDKVVPVVHGVTLAEIEKNCRRIQILNPAPIVIGIGGLVPTLQKCGSVKRASPHTPQRRIAEAVGCARAYFPQASIHLFGVGSLHTVLGVIAIGVHSVDSIGWRQAAGFGSVYIPGRHRRLLTQRAREHPCRPFVNDEDMDILAKCACPACRIAEKGSDRVEHLARHYKPRAVHNIWVLYSEIACYLKSKQHETDKAFLSARLSEAWLDALE